MSCRVCRWAVAAAAALAGLVVVPAGSASAASPWMPRPDGVPAVAAPSVALDPFAVVNPTVPPSIVASPPAQVDQTLTVNPGTWPGSGWTFAYQWLDCDPANPASCVTIPGATASTYTVDPFDGGSTLEVQVNASDGVGDTGSATTAPTATVVAQPGAPVAQTGPSIGGPVAGGVAASASPGTWSPAPDTLTTQWLSCTSDLSFCTTVGVAGASSYAPVAADAGRVLVFAVFATRNGLDSVAEFSAPSNVVTFPAPIVTVTTPVAGTTYPVLGTARALYSCTPPAGMTVASCTATATAGVFSVGVANGARFAGFGTLGPATFVATAIDSDGQSASATVGYTIGPYKPQPVNFILPLPPTVTIAAPADGATYVQGATVLAAFTCTGGGTCTAAQAPGSAVTAGQAVDTSTLGSHTLTATSTNAVTTTTRTATYTVVPLSITTLAQSSARWHAGKVLPGIRSASGTTFTFTSNGAAEVEFAFSREARGRLHGKRCVTGRRRGPRCTRALAAGTFSEAVAAGAGTVAFDGPLGGGRKLAPGAYTVKVTAQALGGTPAAPLGAVVSAGSLRFTVEK